MPAMALLDRDGVYGSPRFHLAAKKNGIKAHIGAEITVQSPKSKVQGQTKSNNAGQRTLDIGRWTLDKTTQVRQWKRFRFPSWFVTVLVIKIFAA